MGLTIPVVFDVVGIAAPKGSTKAFPIRRKNGRMGAVVTEANAHTRPWVSLVKYAAWAAVPVPGTLPFASPAPVVLDITFALPRPTSLPKKYTDHCKKPDLDKLARAVKDALTGIMWTDDAQVTVMHCRKRYVYPNEMPHALISVDLEH